MDDLISRQALCEYALNQKDKSVTPNDIMRFPSAQPELIAQDAYVRGFEQGRIQGKVDAKLQPEPKTGHWIILDSDSERCEDIKCPFCGHTFTVDAWRWCDIGFIKEDFNFCPNCGAHMKGGTT